MNKNIFAGLAVSAVIAMAASAPVLASNEASITDNFGCYMLDQSGNVTIYVDVSHAVINHGNKGVLKCYATGVANDYGKAIRQSGFGCIANGILTYRSWQVIDTEGNATLTCQTK